MTWAAPTRFKLGDFVIAHDGAHRDLPALVLDTNNRNESLVSGWNEQEGVWQSWFPNYLLIHDIHAYPAT